MRTVTCRTLPPPSPEQLSVKPVSRVSGPTVSEPLSDLLPLQPSDAVQLLALEADQERVTESPLAIRVLEALKVTDAGPPPEPLAWLPDEEELPLQPERTKPQHATRPTKKRRPGSNIHFRCAELGGFTGDDQLNCMDLTIDRRRLSGEALPTPRLYQRRGVCKGKVRASSQKIQTLIRPILCTSESYEN